MTCLLLDGYKPIKERWPVYTLNTATKEVTTQWFPNQAKAKKAGPKCGVGDTRKTGRWRSTRDGFFALYVHDGALHLWLDGSDVNLDSHNVVVRRNTDFLLRKRFRVGVDGKAAFECRYSYLDYEEVPDQDIFWFISRSLADPERRRRTLLILEDKAKGIDQSTDNYFQTLDQRAKRGGIN
jgi:hypothetical protein